MITLDGDAIDEIRLANTLRLFPDVDHEDVDRAYRAIRRFSRLCDNTDFRASYSFTPATA